MDYLLQRLLEEEGGRVATYSREIGMRWQHVMRAPAGVRMKRKRSPSRDSSVSSGSSTSRGGGEGVTPKSKKKKHYQAPYYVGPNVRKQREASTSRGRGVSREASASMGSSTDKSTSRGSSTDRSTSRGRGVSMEASTSRVRGASTSSSDEEEEHEAQQAAWVNLRTYMANQLEQNMEVHVVGALLRRVKEYLMSVHLLAELDRVNWGHRREQLFDMVYHGTVECHVGRMSQQLKTRICAQRCSPVRTSQVLCPAGSQGHSGTRLHYTFSSRGVRARQVPHPLLHPPMKKTSRGKRSMQQQQRV
ncbi:hypothetical protein DUNSADRAFT_14228 [Dunaliella salina]|uniref:Uncharacterized protein n=1 Tax=Dunaliella salina TaxID=3046 RepID=A0ABQ7G7S0_DUNSA|nr:hypothetical protein DUNSADRAFT_14228 [Dunaliella salina]|eukprot:KAF5830646.1 hypothetical protein DUNSADRAFT_14228 [Dunaliella salina]